MGTFESVMTRLERSLDALPTVVRDATPRQLAARPRPDKWSALENLAHLGRYQEMFLGRLERIVSEERPTIGRYRAEDDPEFPAWVALPADDLPGRMREGRAGMVARLRGLPDAAWGRTGVHPLYGDMKLGEWLDFFLIHEGHHLYTAVLRLGEARANG